jgi:hypothetical protein
MRLTPTVDASPIDPARSLLPLGRLRSCTHDAVLRIADALKAEPLLPEERTPSLGSGWAARALFFHHVARITDDNKHRELAATFAQRCATALELTPMSVSLYAGFTGIAWLVAHMQRGGDDRIEYDLEDLDTLLSEYVTSESAAAQGFDLVGGLIGIGVYFLERLPADAAVDGLRRVVNRLAERAEVCENGTVWRTQARHLPESLRVNAPDGLYDLGLAHGSPGVVGFLAQVLVRGIYVDHTKALLGDAVRWLRACGPVADPEFSYQCWVSPGRAPTNEMTRAAWCYGDPSVAWALFAAARALVDPNCELFARRLAKAAFYRPHERTGAVDASLCHGTAGLAHMSHAIWLESADPWFAVAARRWVCSTLRFRKEGRGVAGFEYCATGDSGREVWRPDSTFLTGAAGVGLALACALDSSDRSWDRLLLLS